MFVYHGWRCGHRASKSTVFAAFASRGCRARRWTAQMLSHPLRNGLTPQRGWTEGTSYSLLSLRDVSQPADRSMQATMLTRATLLHF